MARKKSIVARMEKQAAEEGNDNGDGASTSSSDAEMVASESDGESGSGSDGESESGSEQQDMDDDDDSDGDGGGGEEDSANVDRVDTSTEGEQCTFDLSNLSAFNTHQINSAELYNKTTGAAKNNEWYGGAPTIEASSSASIQIPNESVLLSKAAEGTTQLLRELWKLPTEKTDVGPMARLPSQETKLPRSLPPPPPKAPSKWEQFALQRNIAPKSKRSRKTYDEATGEWKHLTGSLQNRANAGPESWPIIEVKKNDDPMADPWERIREEKKGRVEKNVESRMRNAERAGTLERGSANKFSKNNQRLEKQKDIAREKERKRGLVAPIGVPSDMTSNRDAKRGKPSTALALRATQASTASLGRFDKQREGEPEKQFSKSVQGKKRGRMADGAGGGGTNKKFLQGEAQKSSDILNRVMNGGSSKEKERDVRKGKYARGETAYDYEFDDGLGAGSFKKKKGRAGMGKMRKVTKKRIK